MLVGLATGHQVLVQPAACGHPYTPNLNSVQAASIGVPPQRFRGATADLRGALDRDPVIWSFQGQRRLRVHTWQS